MTPYKICENCGRNWIGLPTCHVCGHDKSFEVLLQDGVPHNVDEGWTEIGHGHRYKFVGWHIDLTIESNARRYGHLNFDHIDTWGIIDEHRAKKDIRYPGSSKVIIHAGDPCGGGITFNTPEVSQVLSLGNYKKPRPQWNVLSLTPLHLEPSVWCKPPYGCDDHGYIRNDKWIVA